MHANECLHVSENHALQFFLIATNKTKKNSGHFCRHCQGDHAWKKSEKRDYVSVGTHRSFH